MCVCLHKALPCSAPRRAPASVWQGMQAGVNVDIENGDQVHAELVELQQALAQQESGIGRFFKAARPAAAPALAVSS